MSKSVFRSAIENSAGEVDAGYLALWWSMVVTINCIPAIIAAGVYVAIKEPAQAGAVLQNIGVGAGALAAAFGVIVGAVGAFRLGDSRHEQRPS